MRQDRSQGDCRQGKKRRKRKGRNEEKEGKGQAGRKAKDRHESKDMLEVWESIRTHPKAAISDDMSMKWTKRSKDHGEEVGRTEGLSWSRRHPCVACGHRGR